MDVCTLEPGIWPVGILSGRADRIPVDLGVSDQDAVAEVIQIYRSNDMDKYCISVLRKRPRSGKWFATSKAA